MFDSGDRYGKKYSLLEAEGMCMILHSLRTVKDTINGDIGVSILVFTHSLSYVKTRLKCVGDLI